MPFDASSEGAAAAKLYSSLDRNNGELCPEASSAPRVQQLSKSALYDLILKTQTPLSWDSLLQKVKGRPIMDEAVLKKKTKAQLAQIYEGIASDAKSHAQERLHTESFKQLRAAYQQHDITEPQLVGKWEIYASHWDSRISLEYDDDMEWPIKATDMSAIHGFPEGDPRPILTIDGSGGSLTGSVVETGSFERAVNSFHGPMKLTGSTLFRKGSRLSLPCSQMIYDCPYRDARPHLKQLDHGCYVSTELEAPHVLDRLWEERSSERRGGDVFTACAAVAMTFQTESGPEEKPAVGRFFSEEFALSQYKDEEAAGCDEFWSAGHFAKEEPPLIVRKGDLEVTIDLVDDFYPREHWAASFLCRRMDAAVEEGSSSCQTSESRFPAQQQALRESAKQVKTKSACPFALLPTDLVNLIVSFTIWTGRPALAPSCLWLHGACLAADEKSEFVSGISGPTPQLRGRSGPANPKLNQFIPVAEALSCVREMCSPPNLCIFFVAEEVDMEMEKVAKLLAENGLRGGNLSGQIQTVGCTSAPSCVVSDDLSAAFTVQVGHISSRAKVKAWIEKPSKVKGKEQYFADGLLTKLARPEAGFKITKQSRLHVLLLASPNDYLFVNDAAKIMAGLESAIDKSVASFGFVAGAIASSDEDDEGRLNTTVFAGTEFSTDCGKREGSTRGVVVLCVDGAGALKGEALCSGAHGNLEYILPHLDHEQQLYRTMNGNHLTVKTSEVHSNNVREFMLRDNVSGKITKTITPDEISLLFEGISTNLEVPYFYSVGLSRDPSTHCFPLTMFTESNELNGSTRLVLPFKLYTLPPATVEPSSGEYTVAVYALDSSCALQSLRKNVEDVIKRGNKEKQELLGVLHISCGSRNNESYYLDSGRVEQEGMEKCWSELGCDNDISRMPPINVKERGLLDVDEDGEDEDEDEDEDNNDCSSHYWPEMRLLNAVCNPSKYDGALHYGEHGANHRFSGMTGDRKYIVPTGFLSLGELCIPNRSRSTACHIPAGNDSHQFTAVTIAWLG